MIQCSRMVAILIGLVYLIYNSFCGIKYFVPVLYRMAAKVKKSAAPSTIIGKRLGQG